MVPTMRLLGWVEGPTSFFVGILGEVIHVSHPQSYGDRKYVAIRAERNSSRLSTRSIVVTGFGLPKPLPTTESPQ